MLRLRGFAAGTAALTAALALGAAAPAHAQGYEYDTPSVSVVKFSPTNVRLHVTAGPSGAPNGFVVEWMNKRDFDLIGWPADPYDYRLNYCEFSGIPTLYPTANPTGYALGGGVGVDVNPGRLFDETGVSADYTDEMPSAIQVVVRVYALPGALAQSDYSPDLLSGTSIQNDCTLTQGFWKTHPLVWPSSCLPMLLGTVSYTQAELLSIFGTPAAGNGLIFLAHQLIAAKLNICNGADPTPIAATIAAADALIDGLVVPPIGSGFLDPSSASGLTDTLDDYNSGLLGVPHCDTPVKTSTWGRLKAMYR